MFGLIARMFCRHVWQRTGKPYLADAGMTKRCDVRCVICSQEANVDIFDVKADRWAQQGREGE